MPDVSPPSSPPGPLPLVIGVVGHRDLSPDNNQDGKITPNEWLKTCPGFDAGWELGGRNAG